jgi:CRISPR-associated protein Csh2
MSDLPNSEILLLYEAKLCNPNGDPDEENKPRMDPKTNVNLVSDLRLKRFFRDYVISRWGEDYIYVTRVMGKTVRADERVLAGSLSPEEREKFMKGEITKEITKEQRDVLQLAEEVCKRYIDARLFGATVPIGGEERGAQKTFIGPVQFTWGFSLHPVELVESSTITSVFAGRHAEEQYGTMGKDWRLYYSLIAFYGVVGGWRARGTGMREDDVKLLDDILWKALSIQPTTRSKIGERPLLYLRVEYKDAETLIGDFRRYLGVHHSNVIREFKDVKLDFGNLIEELGKHKDKISKIFIHCSEDMENVKELFKDFAIQPLPHGIEEKAPDIFKL